MSACPAIDTWFEESTIQLQRVPRCRCYTTEQAPPAVDLLDGRGVSATPTLLVKMRDLPELTSCTMVKIISPRRRSLQITPLGPTRRRPRKHKLIFAATGAGCFGTRSACFHVVARLDKAHGDTRASRSTMTMLFTEALLGAGRSSPFFSAASGARSHFYRTSRKLKFAAAEHQPSIHRWHELATGRRVLEAPGWCCLVIAALATTYTPKRPDAGGKTVGAVRSSGWHLDVAPATAVGRRRQKCVPHGELTAWCCCSAQDQAAHRRRDGWRRKPPRSGLGVRRHLGVSPA